MKFRILILILIIVSASDIFGKDYTNDQYGIHFILPDYWKTVDFKDLPLEKQQRLDSRNRPFQTLSICGFRDHDGLDRTNVIIQYHKFNKATLDDAKKELRSEHGKEMMISLAKLFAGDAIGKEIEYYNVVETKSDFVSSGNRAYGMIRYKSSDKPSLVSMVVKILCGDSMVTLNCFSIGTEADDFVDTINKMVDSFEFDGGTTTINRISEEVRNLSSEQMFDRIWKWGGIILTISIILGFVKWWVSQ